MEQDELRADMGGLHGLYTRHRQKIGIKNLNMVQQFLVNVTCLVYQENLLGFHCHKTGVEYK